MINNPELINKFTNNINKLDDETIKEAIQEVESEDMEEELIELEHKLDELEENGAVVLDIENGNTIRKLLKENKKLKNMYRKEYDEHFEMKRQNEVLRNNERILRDREIWSTATMEDLKTKFIPISVIQNTLDELDEQIKEFSTYVNESTGEEKQYWKRERAELVGARGALLGLLKIERNK